ncbi:hypothetical protein Tco_0682823 [Tanacetum coccineum]|uniref:Uncharacterized protein n=1 Tax=Tanacetum coccineum TaxID=301880 RepID=A0ABQ4XTP0_9ASTR
MGYLVRAYYNISPTRYYKDDPCWNADLKSKTTEDIISIRSFVEVFVLNHYVLARKIFFVKPNSGIIRKLPEVEGKGKGIVSNEQAAQSLLNLQKPKNKSTTDQYIFQRQTPATQDSSTRPFAQPQDDTSANVADTEIFNNDEEHGEEVSHTVALEERNVELDEGQARSDPAKTPESRPEPEHELMEEDQAGSNPRQSHHTTEEQVLIENPPSSIRTLSLMNNLDDAFTFSDQFLNDKPMEEEPGKANVETEVESMVIVPIHQASSSVPPLSTPIIDLTPPKPVSPPIDKQVNKVVKEAVHNALQAPLHERFRDLSEAQMTEILHDRMFESDSYKSHPDHATLYEDL